MISKSHPRRALLPASIHLAALILAALTLCGALAARPAQAAEWMRPYLEQVQEWGVMRGDASGNLHEDRPITRAEFVTLVNRAFGYTEVGPSPFTDVSPNAWYAEDISIAHQAGYFNGTSPTTASPLSLVTREQAAVLLGRCLRLQGTAGVADSSFTDVHDIGGWSRGLVQEAADLGIIQGYADGSFRPRLPITRGQVACFLVRALGTLIQEPGEQSSGGVYGNLTVTVPGVKLKDTTITGNLYLTGGVGLGNLELENVNVLGKIVICGSGEAEHGDHSVILRNVTAGSLEVDSLMDQFLSIRAEGLTTIDNIVVRTSAYLEDLTEDGLGLKLIRLDGAAGTRLQLAGNIKEVLNLTPNSILHLAQGLAGVVTMDEKAVGASLTIDVDSCIKELNLDTATPVTGAGSITHLNISAPGSNVSMLPDTIYVRPGITGSVNNVNMDNKAAAEASDDPRLLAGYPAARNVAPTSADAVFRTNKTGTIRWAITALMDGSLGEEELMDPASYSKILRSGTINATASNTDFTARLTGLTKEGSYYISALLVDARGRRSPVKVAAFTTPDDSAPNFATGYPQAPILTTDANGEQVAQIMVMPTKDCQMYYVLLPKGSTAPTAADFRSAALPGNLGYGVVTLRKNTPFLLSRINTSYLQEKTDYDLYLWLNDADNGKSSAVRKITVTTKDITPPTITDLSQKSNTATSVTVRFILDEPGTLSWAAVRQGASIRVDKENPTQYDQIRIENISVDGVTVIRSGGPVRAARGGEEYTFTISGLQAQTSYDLYYMAKDTAGNYCVYNETIEFPYPIRTLDNEHPTAWMDFTGYDEISNVRYPRLDSDVMIQFSEVVDGYFSQVTGGDAEDENLEDLYARVLSSTGEARAQAKTALSTALQRHISFHTGTPPGQSNPSRDSYVAVLDDTSTAEDINKLPAWIDYREAVITRREVELPGTGQRVVGICITFPAGTGIKLQSGARYFFHLKDFWDTVGLSLKIDNTLNSVNLPSFATVSARVIAALEPLESVTYDDGTDLVTNRAWVFSLDPQNTESVYQDTRWDMLIWANASIRYDLLVRMAGDQDWSLLGPISLSMTGVASGKAYASLNGSFNSLTNHRLTQSDVSYMFGNIQEGQGRPHLNQFVEKMEFAIVPVMSTVEKTVNIEIQILAGGNEQFFDISRTPGTASLVADKDVTPTGVPDPLTFPITRYSAPTVSVNPNGVTTEPTEAKINVTIRPSGDLYYIAVRLDGDLSENSSRYTLVGSLADLGDPAVSGSKPSLKQIPTEGTGLALDANSPSANELVDLISDYITYGNAAGDTPFGKISNRSTATLTLDDLQPNSTYLLYLITQDKDAPHTVADRVLCYKFTTDPPVPPKILITPYNTTSQATFQVDIDSEDIKYLLLQTRQLLADPKFGSPFGGDYYNAPDGYTVLQAMVDAYDTANNSTARFQESIFDHYAPLSLKNEMARYLRQMQNIFDPPANMNPELFDLAKETPREISMDAIDTTEEYTLVVVARGADSDLDGFRASTAFRATQDNHLYLYRPVMQADDNVYDLTSSFTGTLTISFDDNLRLLVGGTAYRIDGCEMGHSLHLQGGEDLISTDGYIPYQIAIPTMAPSTRFRLDDPATAANGNHGGVATTSFTFHLNAVPSGAYIVFDGRLCGNRTKTVKSPRDALMIEIKYDPVTQSWSAAPSDTRWYKNGNS